MDKGSSIKWPEQFSPDNVDVRVSNELEMSVSPSAVWAWLVRASLWPTWYRNSANVIIEGGARDLRLGAKFKWKTFGLNLESKVEEFSPSERLAWSAHGFGVDAYHAWLIEEKESGCRVLTEENQRGTLAKLNKLLRPNNMEKYHQMWLEVLYSKAKGGLPP